MDRAAAGADLAEHLGSQDVRFGAELCGLQRADARRQEHTDRSTPTGARRPEHADRSTPTGACRPTPR
jgi:hypothetical protein